METARGARVLTVVGPDAAALGVREGQSLAHARAIHPGLTVVEADPAADARALEGLTDWCLRYTPLVATDRDGLWLDIAGCAHLHGGEPALLDDLAGRLARCGIGCRLAVAGATGAAWALARSPMGRDRHVTPPGGERAALRDLPVAGLRLDPRVVAGLRRLGLRTIGELAKLPRGEVTARFGAQPALRLDQAFGRAEEAILWRHPCPSWSERLDFAEPIGAPDDLARALDMLTQRLCARLAEQGQGGHRFVARFFRVDASAQAVAVVTGLPTRDAAYLGKLLREKLDGVDPGFGVETVLLDAEETAALSAPQMRLADLASSDATARVTDVIANRIGHDLVWRMAPHASHVPERAVTRAPALGAGPAWTGTALPRPIRLLRNPEPIAVTSLLPDEPPATFRWRGVMHTVRAATGPERIAAEWWRGAAAEHEDSGRLRDYYQVEDAHGARFWVFRAGLHGRGRMPLWYMHGLFA